MSSLLRAEGVTVLRGGCEAVRGVDIELRRGEIVALLGPNGAGKSTLLDCLSGAIAPTAGHVQRDGRVAVALQAGDLARRTALANVELGLAWWGIARGAGRQRRALEALRELGVEDLAGRPITQLSGGERRRVHLARALAVQADVLLLDEPFAGLDGETRARLLEDATSLLRSDQRATVVVVHDRAEAFALADRLVIMIAGRLVADGPPQQLLDAPPSADVARFLGYDGAVRSVDGTETLTRPRQVTLDPAGPLTAHVVRVVPVEDGARLELRLDGGTVFARASWPAPALGSTVHLRLDGGVSFPTSD